MTGHINDQVRVAQLGVGFFPPWSRVFASVICSLCKTTEIRPELRQRWSQTSVRAIPRGGSSEGACSGAGWKFLPLGLPRIIKILVKQVDASKLQQL